MKETLTVRNKTQEIEYRRNVAEPTVTDLDVYVVPIANSTITANLENDLAVIVQAEQSFDSEAVIYPHDIVDAQPNSCRCNSI